MTIQLADVIASVVLATVGNGLLGTYLLQRQQAEHERRLERLKTDMEGEIRTLQTALDRTVFVHRAHFETEFAALRDIWTTIAAVRATMGLVRPIADVIPAGETPEQREARELQRFQNFSVAFDALVNSVDSQSPFVPRDIYQELERAIQIARNEQTEVSVERNDRDRNPMRDWYQRGREHFQEFCASAARVSDLIRARLESLTLVSESR